MLLFQLFDWLNHAQTWATLAVGLLMLVTGLLLLRRSRDGGIILLTLWGVVLLSGIWELYLVRMIGSGRMELQTWLLATTLVHHLLRHLLFLGTVIYAVVRYWRASPRTS